MSVMKSSENQITKKSVGGKTVVGRTSRMKNAKVGKASKKK